jgi:hypothetical protein
MPKLTINLQKTWFKKKTDRLIKYFTKSSEKEINRDSHIEKRNVEQVLLEI